MLSQHTTKPHNIKWAEAERDLAIRGMLPVSSPVSHEYSSIQQPDSLVPQSAEDADSKEESAGP